MKENEKWQEKGSQRKKMREGGAEKMKRGAKTKRK